MITAKNTSTVTASAPGRLDVMGGIADYSGAWVLQMPITEQATVKLAFRNDDLIRVVSSDMAEVFELNVKDLPLEFETARHFFKQQKGFEWVSYVLGCLVVLTNKKALRLKQGLDFSINSDVPMGKGVSSSAALEVATMRALSKLFDLKFQGTELAILAQIAENKIVGAPCGLMDQLASCFGQPGQLLPIKCQPDRVASSFSAPQGIHFVGIDSGIRHAVSGASYSDVRTAAFMGLHIIEKELGRPLGGYLCNLSPSDFEQNCAPILPESMGGREFLEKYGATNDPSTMVDPGKIYKIKSCAKHPVYENFRVTTFGKLLLQNIDNESLMLLGELMFQSHESYSSIGLGNEHTDEIVEMVRAVGHGSGVFGAKITGGGSGGTVCLGCFEAEGLETAKAIYQSYKVKYGLDIRFFET